MFHQAFPADCPRVRWILTADVAHDFHRSYDRDCRHEDIVNEYQTVFEEFPAYGSVLLRLANLFFNLRTVIVTAAVYWGFGSTLRLR
jgi:hypothetical protein